MYKVIVKYGFLVFTTDKEDYTGTLHDNYLDAYDEYKEAINDPKVSKAWIYDTSKDMLLI